jgi:hypothetical protein
MIRRSLVLFAALFFAVSAHAQLAAYGTFTVSRLSGINSSPYAAQYGSPEGLLPYVNPLGGTGGVSYDFMNLGPIRLGADVRGSILSTHRGGEAAFDGTGARIESGLGGVKASFHTPYKFLTPYVQASAGIGRSDYGLTGFPLHSNFEYHLFAGLDVHAFPIMDFRVAELGYGGLDASGNDSHNYPLKTFSAGVVFHFPASQ